MAEDDAPASSPLRRRSPGAPAAKTTAAKAAPAAATPAAPPVTTPVAQPDPLAPPPAEPAATGLQRLSAPVVMLALISLAVGVLVGGFTAYYEYTRPATYQSTAVMLIDQASDLSTGADVGVVDKLSKLRIKYVGIVRTQVFADPVATAVGLPEPQVRHALRAAIDPNSLLMTVSAITRNRQQSQTIAEEAGKQLVSYVQHEQDVVRVPDASRVTFTVVTPAGTAVRITPDRRRAELVGLFVFLAITIAGLLGADLLRRSRRQS